MKTCKRLIILQYHCDKELEKRLENYAKEGLFLEKIGTIFHTFRKAEPQNLKYTVTYFKEGSVFNPEHTENQLTYFEYAKASGWDFICEKAQVQIFSSSNENPIPFETDEEEKLENIHACMKKTFLISQIMLLVMWLFNLVIRISSLVSRPVDFLSDGLELATCLMIASAAFFSAYMVLNYLIWYRKSKKSVQLGGEICNPYSRKKQIFEISYVFYIFVLVAYIFAVVFTDTNIVFILLAAMQVPVFIGAFSGAIAIQKKLKVAAKINRAVTFTVYIFVCMLYCGFVFSVVGNYDFGDYTYEETAEQTIFLKKEAFVEDVSLPDGDTREIDYTVYTSEYDWVSDLVMKEVTHIEDFYDSHIEEIGSEAFDAEEAYTFYYTGSGETNYQGKYVLVYEDRIILLYTGEPLEEHEVKSVIGSWV